MKKYWYRRILIMALVFFVSVGGSYLLIEQKKDAMRREVSAQTSEEDLVIPGGMPVGIYMKTKGVMVFRERTRILPRQYGWQRDW